MGESLMASLGRSMGSECVSACDSVNTLLVEETDIVSTSVKVFCWFITTQFVRLVGGTHIRRFLRARLNGKDRLVRGSLHNHR